MARVASVALLLLAAAVLSTPSVAQTIPTPQGYELDPRNVQPVEIVEPTTESSDRSDDPTEVDKVNQEFIGKNQVLGSLHTGVRNNKPFGEVSVLGSDKVGVPAGRKLMAGARKLLQPVGVSNLYLYGDGVGAGSKDAGVDARAFGSGRNQNGLVGGTHIQPHGVEVQPSVAGEKTTVVATANPDCVFDATESGKDAYCTQVGKK